MNTWIRRSSVCGLLLFLSLISPALVPSAQAATPTETLLLSGTDRDHTVPWEFMVTTGRNSGVWKTIPVPSNWETKGFGTYSHGYSPAPGEVGMYKVSFTPPARFANKRVSLVFEGSMTDTTVKINGNSAGPMHQGGFYLFKYDVTALLQVGKPNLLEVTVSKDSADTSVNRAERLGDYWAFAGIYRPVYLEVRPQESMERVAINARADGSVSADVFLNGVQTADTLTGQVETLNGKAVGAAFSLPITAGQAKQTLTTQAANPLLWTAETPHRYQLQVKLMRGKNEIHRITQPFGFRTVEVRKGDGIYVNNKKVILKGAPRHSFWPDSGRTTSPTISRDDVLVMKGMNMNAVLCAHYPPDQHFLDTCDELGLYVLDELAGWQKKYDTGIGTKLVEEMVLRDVNHPSILFWCNGNEGGWNTELDNNYALYDPQKRSVLHPWTLMSGVQTKHYPNYQAVQGYMNGTDIFMPTEFLHALYDGGAGAGLNDYWDLMMSKPVGAGGFIWALTDEGIVRDDRKGAMDVNGNNYPDGIVGPYREKEGSYYTIKDIWSPLQIIDRANFSGQVGLTNHYVFTDAKECRFSWQLLRFNGPSGQAGHTVSAKGSAASPTIAPGATGTLSLSLPAHWRDADALVLSASDPFGREINTWTWPLRKAADVQKRIVPTATSGAGAATATETADAITLSANGTLVTISKTTGRLMGVTHNGKPVGFANGPTLASGTAELTGTVTHSAEGAAQVVQANYSGNLASVQWRLLPSGWLQLQYQYHLSGPQDFMGVNFDYPEKQVAGIKWLGQGPYRVWKNRMRGPTLDVWAKAYNDTATGAEGWVYPEFKGYYASTYWAQLQTTEGKIMMVTPDENLFLRLYTPRNGPDPRGAAGVFPSGDISFLDGIPPMGNKFTKAEATGPEGAPNNATGDYRHILYFYFGDLGASPRP